MKKIKSQKLSVVNSREIPHSFFSESNQKSVMRLGFLIAVVTGCYCAVAAIHLGRDLVSAAALVGVILGAAFGGKSMQKKFEGN